MENQLDCRYTNWQQCSTHHFQYESCWPVGLHFEVSSWMYSVLEGQDEDVKLEELSWLHCLLAFITFIFLLKFWFRLHWAHCSICFWNTKNNLYFFFFFFFFLMSLGIKLLYVDPVFDSHIDFTFDIKWQHNSTIIVHCTFFIHL